MGNTPSIFEPTPQEHALATARSLEKQREVVIWPPEAIVPPGHVRVQFYAHRYKVRDGLRPDIESVLPLHKSGALSLFSVRRRWGLETCSIIDPPQMKLGFSRDPHWLPADVVKDIVAKHGCIKLIEPYTSYGTLMKRELRHIVLASTSVLQSYSILARAGAENDYRAVRHRLSQRIYVSKSRYWDWGYAANLAATLTVLFLIFASARGIDLGIVRFGKGVADAVLASAGLSFGFWACLAVAFLAAQEHHAKTLGLEDGPVELKLVLCA